MDKTVKTMLFIFKFVHFSLKRLIFEKKSYRNIKSDPDTRVPSLSALLVNRRDYFDTDFGMYVTIVKAFFVKKNYVIFSFKF